MNEHTAQLVLQAAEILKAAGAREVYLFGSAARGTMDVDSDVDIAVSGLPPRQFFPAMARAAAVLQRSLDLVDLDYPTPFTRYLKEEGDMARVV